MTLRGVLFDLDGTLADTPWAERRAWPALASIIQRHVPAVDLDELQERYATAFEQHWTAFLDGRIDFATYRRGRLSEALSPWCEVDDELYEAYRTEKRRSIDGLEAFPDAVATIGCLREHGLRVGLLTNGPSSLQRSKLEITRLADELDGIAISEEIGVAKPEREAFRRAAELIGCELGEVAMVGDSPTYDIAGAVAAGLPKAVLVCNGLDVWAADCAVVPGLADVPAALGLT